MMKTEMLAMILAGGRGSRLHELTNKSAKPAVYYGGKYRIIDFPLSNCANSNINYVGILTQYESILLNSYVSQASVWGLEGRNSGTFVLSPREKNSGFGLYRGTADAIYQNLDFIEQYNPQYVLILSGDHIYKMDYAEMLAFHKENQADVTVAALTVTLEEAKRFGIMNAYDNKEVYQFEEKPKEPKSNLASMGIYIFNFDTLKKALIADNKKDTAHDFGKNIIPNLLAEGKKVFAYPFSGYWKDVGTVESLWQANMDLLAEDNPLNLADEKWKIFTEDIPTSPQFIGKDAQINCCCINQGCIINGKVENSVLFRDVTVQAGAEVYDSVIMPNVVIEKGAVVRKCIVAEGVTIKKDNNVGSNDKVDLIALTEE
ncbi:MAG: glucose-1-phosphate adenylyltransferase [Erysipelotrichia bacterium]|nr:glucose-1-phosphate adenylyltransferase [Erysipelotrichia bacterium]